LGAEEYNTATTVPKELEMKNLNPNMLVKIIHTDYKKVNKINKKTGEEYPAIQPDGAPCGVVVAVKSPRGPIKVGWSKCNFKAGDKFNKEIGLKTALKNLHTVKDHFDIDEPYTGIKLQEEQGFLIVDKDEIPHNLTPQVLRMATRALKYYNKKAKNAEA
jgi:hypothetical protein